MITPLSRRKPNKSGSMSVRPSRKSVSDVDKGMPYDPIQGQGQGHRVPKFEKWPISKPFSFAGMHVIKRLTVNYDTPRLSTF